MPSAISANAGAQILDLAEAFGPLAAMHAAMERQGIGTPCSAAARFPGRAPEEVRAALLRVAATIPVLASRLVWQGRRPVLQLGAGEPAQLDDPFTFHSDDRGIWGYRVVEDAGGTWLVVAFAHAAADGPSMLRLQSAVAAELAGRDPPRDAVVQRRPLRQQSMAAWLPGFLLEHARRYDSLSPASAPPRLGACFAVLPMSAAARLQQTARECGVAARLGAAAASAVLEQDRGRAEGEVYLNMPISRAARALGGFGFDGSSVRFPLRLSGREAGIDALAATAGRRLRSRIERGWDVNLSRLLGGSPSRRLMFAAIQARKPRDPCLTISWKGRRPGLGARAGVVEAACFAAAPTLHLSAHTSDDGLSLSLTTSQAPSARRALFERIVDRLGLDLAGAQPIRDIADLIAADDDQASRLLAACRRRTRSGL